MKKELAITGLKLNAPWTFDWDATPKATEYLASITDVSLSPLGEKRPKKPSLNLSTFAGSPGEYILELSATDGVDFGPATNVKFTASKSKIEKFEVLAKAPVPSPAPPAPTPAPATAPVATSVAVPQAPAPVTGAPANAGTAGTVVQVNAGTGATTRRTRRTTPRRTSTRRTTTPAPVISNLFVSARTQTSATVQWTTDLTSTSTVNFGTTVAYNGVPVFDTAPVTNHSVDLTGLTAGTTYHFVAKSAANGLTTVSEDKTFDTLAVPLTWWQNFRKKYLNWKWIILVLIALMLLAALWKYGGPLWEKLAKAGNSTASQQAAGPTPQSNSTPSASALPPIPINREPEVRPGHGHTVEQDLNTGQQSEVIDRVIEYPADTRVEVNSNSGTDNRFRSFYMTNCFNNLSNVTVTIGSDDRSINGSSVGNTTMFPVVPPPHAPRLQDSPQTNAPTSAPGPQTQYAPTQYGPTFDWGPPDPTYRPEPLPNYVPAQQPIYVGGGGGYTYLGGYDPYGYWMGGVGFGINLAGRGYRGNDWYHGGRAIIHERIVYANGPRHSAPHFGGGGGNSGGSHYSGSGGGNNHGSGGRGH